MQYSAQAEADLRIFNQHVRPNRVSIEYRPYMRMSDHSVTFYIFQPGLVAVWRVATFTIYLRCLNFSTEQFNNNNLV